MARVATGAGATEGADTVSTGAGRDGAVPAAPTRALTAWRKRSAARSCGWAGDAGKLVTGAGAGLVSSNIESSSAGSLSSDGRGAGIAAGGASEGRGGAPGASSAMMRLMDARMSSIDGSGRASAMSRTMPYFWGAVTFSTGTTAETLGSLRVEVAIGFGRSRLSQSKKLARARL